MNTLNSKNLRIMTVDVEEYFQVGAFEGVVNKKTALSKYPSRLEDQLMLISDIFADADVKSTFFVLGSVLGQPGVSNILRRLHKEGHEIASHGMNHDRVYSMSHSEFFIDAMDSKKRLEDLIGERILGYRAPSFSITDKSHFEILKEVGYKYSSSTYPINHDHYGSESWPAHPNEPVDGLLEIPQSIVRCIGKNFPAGGGGYFRLLPMSINLWLIKTQERQCIQPQPYMFYCHPWELDERQPNIPGISRMAKFRHYVNLRKMPEKFRRLCASGKWISVKDAYKNDLF